MSGEQDILLLGIGGVGQALLRQIQSNKGQLLARGACLLNVVVVCDSKSAWEGLDDNELLRLVSWKASADGQPPPVSPAEQAPRDLVLDRISNASVSQRQLVVVDCSASTETADILVAAVEAGARVVSANKKPFTGPQSVFDALTANNRRSVRFESTVGAGLPVVTAFGRLSSSGDDVESFSGCMSGTIGL
jgi:homoserine dehydrogenase